MKQAMVMASSRWTSCAYARHDGSARDEPWSRGAGYHGRMKDGPHLASVAALIGERARADMLTALMGGQALTATELAAEADIGKPTASGHLARLVERGLLSVES